MADFRPAGREDERLLRRVLWLAVHWDEEPPPPFPGVLAPELARYVEGFGRAGDEGIVALVGAQPAGAAWYRQFSADEPGYGFVSGAIPELVTAVMPGHRGTGLGTDLLGRLLERAEASGVEGISLSVQVANPAARLYERLGFERVGAAGTAWTMLRRFG
jgi:ribosomal protein S18 acetylase RimI-like enzyme